MQDCKACQLYWSHRCGRACCCPVTSAEGTTNSLLIDIINTNAICFRGRCKHTHTNSQSICQKYVECTTVLVNLVVGFNLIFHYLFLLQTIKKRSKKRKSIDCLHSYVLCKSFKFSLRCSVFIESSNKYTQNGR